MKYRKTAALLAALLLTLGLLTGCGGPGEAGSPNAEKSNPAFSEAAASSPASPEAEPRDGAAEFSFSDLSNLEFWFGSGAGAWRTVLYVADDGSFEGEYTDFDAGSAAGDFPNGSCYVCTFSGQLSQPEKVNDYTYSARLERLDLEREPDAEETRDGIRYIYSEPYGLDDAEELLFYLPGAPVEELPEGYVQWALGYGDAIGETLPFYGLYNAGGDQGFSSHER
mgnify:CR=1 FL=1